MVESVRCRLQIVGEDEKSIAASLKREILNLAPGALPLEQGITRGGYVDHSNIDATVIEVVNRGDLLRARIGVFFNEIVGGCSCGDDPVAENAWCEFSVRVNRITGEAQFMVIKG